MTNAEGWGAKVGHALRGLFHSAKTETSFAVHLPVAAAVVAVAAWLRVEPWRWAILLLSIGSVLSAELLNTSIERLVRALRPDRDPVIGEALDAAAAAVLVIVVSAVAVGLIALGPPLWAVVFGG